VPDAAGDVESFGAAVVGQSTRSGGKQPQTLSTGEVADDPAGYSFTQDSVDGFTTGVTTLTATVEEAASAQEVAVVPRQRPTLVSIVTNLVSAVLQPFMGPDTGSPIQAPLLWAVLSAVRNEMERVLFRRTANVAPQQTVAQLVDPTPNVLVIGVDGANLSRILADDSNQNFFELMDDGTTAAASIVGHTTISNPSWTAILTGVWGEKSGVINNVFTPWTYDRWPTVFNQLEAHNPDIQTTAIADWDGITAIAGAGSIPADEIVFVPQIGGDTNWSKTDDAVGDVTVEAIGNTAAGVPSFLFTYFAGVDENGHTHGGASPQYAEAIRNVDDNLGEILAAVKAWETANPGEGEWTVIVVTDHGHQPQQGFGHGFQSPDETATFVIASGRDFNDGFINLQYEIVDTTPTVLTLFGGKPAVHSDGVSLTTLGGSDVDPVDLHQALNDAIAMNGYPDIITNVALSLRTIAATVPYVVYTLTNDITAALQAIADQGTFLISPLAAVAAVAVQIVGDGLYVLTNVPAQIVARLTGVTGASIFPLLPPEPPSTSTPEQATLADVVILACSSGGAPGSDEESWCGAGSVA
jgi:hypothetical protein